MDTRRVTSEEPTTPDLAGLVRRFDDALNTRDFDALMSFYAADAVASFGMVGSCAGQAAIRAFWEEWVGAFAEFENDVEDIRDLGGGLVFIVFTQRGRPPRSASWVQVRSATVLTLAHGVITRQANSVDIDEARADAERLARERG